MKEIDLLPQWYKSGRAKQRNLRGQYMVMAAVVVIMLVWNFLAVNSLSTARAQLSRDRDKYTRAQAVIEQAERLAQKIEKLKKKAALIDQADSRINIANVLSELSFLINERVVLSDVSLEAEKMPAGWSNSTSGSGLRVAGSSKKASEAPVGDVRFKGKVRGIAAETGDVGELVRKLEQSEYFRDVSLAFSRSRQIKASSADTNEQRRVSEFEINFHLANYKVDDGRMNKKNGL